MEKKNKKQSAFQHIDGALVAATIIIFVELNFMTFYRLFDTSLLFFFSFLFFFLMLWVMHFAV